MFSRRSIRRFFPFFSDDKLALLDTRGSIWESGVEMLPDCFPALAITVTNLLVTESLREVKVRNLISVVTQTGQLMSFVDVFVDINRR